MKEVFFHLFVWLISPAFIGATAFYGLYRSEYFLGAMAAAFALVFCLGTAAIMFDGHLLSYGLLYGAYSLIPAIMFVVAICSCASSILQFFIRRRGDADISQPEELSASGVGAEG